MKYHLSVIIPAYNEEKRLPSTLERTIDFLRKQPYTSEIIVVTDGSTDNTAHVARSFAKDFPSLTVIEQDTKVGKGYAVKLGMLSANGDYRLFMDADYAVPIEYISSFLSLAKRNNAIVIASRGLEKSILEKRQKFLREKMARLFGVIQRQVLGLPIIDTQCGFKLFDEHSTKRIFNALTYTCSYFDAELLYIAHHSGIPIEEVPVAWRHDNETRLPIGMKRSVDLFIKLFKIKRIHRFPRSVRAHQ